MSIANHIGGVNKMVLALAFLALTGCDLPKIAPCTSVGDTGGCHEEEALPDPVDRPSIYDEEEDGEPGGN